MLDPGFPRPADWRDRAACLGMDPDVFFPEKGQTIEVRRAKATCAACSVRADCLDFAITNNEMAGIWGGLTRKERRVVKRRQRAA